MQPEANARIISHAVAGSTAEGGAGVRLLVVPHVASDELGRIQRADLDPPAATLERIAESLDARRLVGTRLLVQPPDYAWLTAVVSLSCRPLYEPGEVRTEVLRARGSILSVNHGERQSMAVATFHPRLLLERPAQKADAWKDLQLLMGAG